MKHATDRRIQGDNGVPAVEELDQRIDRLDAAITRFVVAKDRLMRERAEAALRSITNRLDQIGA